MPPALRVSVRMSARFTPDTEHPPLAGPWRLATEPGIDRHGDPALVWYVCADCPDGFRLRLTDGDPLRAQRVVAILERLYPAPSS